MIEHMFDRVNPHSAASPALLAPGRTLRPTSTGDGDIHPYLDPYLEESIDNALTLDGLIQMENHAYARQTQDVHLTRRAYKMRFTHSWKYRLASMVGAVSLVICLPGSASAYAQVKVGSSSEIGISDSYTNPLTGQKTVLRAIGYFSNHKSGSVKLTKIKLCYSDSSKQPAYLTPAIYKGNGSLVWEKRATRDVPSGECISYAIDKTFSASSGKELLHVETRIATQNFSLTSRFMR